MLIQAYPGCGQRCRGRTDSRTKVGRSGLQRSLFVLSGSVGFVLPDRVRERSESLAGARSRPAHEFSIRAALGAGQRRIVQQLLTESTLLAAIGGGLGVLLAATGTRAMLGALRPRCPRAEESAWMPRLDFCGGAVVAGRTFFGLTPALRTARRDLQGTLKEGGRGGSGTRHRTQGALVAAEMALALVLLIGAGLMIRTLAALSNVNPGFEADKVLTFGFSLPPSMMNASRMPFGPRSAKCTTNFNPCRACKQCRSLGARFP